MFFFLVPVPLWFFLLLSVPVLVGKLFFRDPNRPSRKFLREQAKIYTQRQAETAANNAFCQNTMVTYTNLTGSYRMSLAKALDTCIDPRNRGEVVWRARLGGINPQVAFEDALKYHPNRI